MNIWLKRFYILLTVGGGFLGLGIFITQMLRPGIATAGYILLGVSACFYACGVIVGLCFIEKERKALPLVALYLAPQIPIISTPIIAFQISSGFTLRASIIGAKFSFYGGIGSDASLWIGGSRPWGVGVNLLALVALVIVARQIHANSKTAEPGATDNPDDAQRN